MSANLPELISAYLDGEVTAEERAAVEQTLVEDATLRRFFYELRALRKQLARLPRYKLKADLSREVLRRAERVLLQPVVGIAEAHNAAESVASNSPTVPSPISTSGVQRPTPWWQAAVWIGATIAASLLLIVLQPGKDAGPEQVAFVPTKQNPESQRRGLAPNNSESRRGEAAIDSKFAKRQPEATSNSPAAPVAGVPPLDAVVTNADRTKSGPGVSLKFAENEREKDEVFGQLGKEGGDYATESKQIGGGGFGGGVGVDGKEAAGAMPLSSKLAAAKDNQPKEEDRAKSDALGASFGSGQRPHGEAQPGGFGGRAHLPPPVAKQAAKGTDGAPTDRYADETFDDAPLAQSDGTVMIRCDVNGREFEPLLRTSLARHNIVWSESAETAVAQTKGLSTEGLPSHALEKFDYFRHGEGIVAASNAPSADASRPLPATQPKDPARQDRAAEDKVLDSPTDPGSPTISPEAVPSSPDAELVYVVATREQIEGVLTELRDHPRVFLAANVHPVPGSKSQEELTQWNWSVFADTDRLLAESDANKPGDAGERKSDAKKLDEKKSHLNQEDEQSFDRKLGDKIAADGMKTVEGGALDRPDNPLLRGARMPADKNDFDKNKVGKDTLDKYAVEGIAAKRPSAERDAAKYAEKELLHEEAPAEKPFAPLGAATRMRLSVDPKDQVAERKVVTVKALAAPQGKTSQNGKTAPQETAKPTGSAVTTGAAPAALDEATVDREKLLLGTAQKTPLNDAGQAPSAAQATKLQPAQRSGGIQAADDLSLPADTATTKAGEGKDPAGKDQAPKGEASEIRASGRVANPPLLRVLFVFRVQPSVAPVPAAGPPIPPAAQPHE